MKLFKIFLFALIIPYGCSLEPGVKVKNIWNEETFSYSQVNKTVESIEINKSILFNAFQVSAIELSDIRVHKKLSQWQLLDAFQSQLNEVILAMKKITAQTSKNYFADLEIHIDLSPTTKSELKMVAAKNNQLYLVMGSHLNSQKKKSHIETLSSTRIYQFMAKNIKSFD